MGEIAIALLKRYLPQIIIGLALICGYFAWKHHIEAVQHEKDMAEVERKTKELLQRKMVEVKIENDELQVRKDNAIKIYAERSADVERDANNLAKRMSISTGSCRDTMPGKADDDSRAERRSVEENRGVAVEIISVLNMCEYWINQIPVK